MKYFLLVVFLLSSCAREIKDNNLKLGTGTANDVVIEASIGNVDNPKLKYDTNDEVWKFSNDGLAFSEVSPPLIIDDLTEKVTPVNDDVLVIEDSADSFNKKKVKISSLPSGGGGGGGLLPPSEASSYTKIYQVMGSQSATNTTLDTGEFRCASSGTNAFGCGLGNATAINQSQGGPTLGYSLRPGTTSTGWGAIKFGAFRCNKITYSTRVTFSANLSDATNRYTVHIGLVGFAAYTNTHASGISSGNSIYLSYVDNLNSGRFQIYTRDESGNLDTINTSISVSASTKYDITIISELGVGFQVYINGSLVHSGSFFISTATSGIPEVSIIPIKAIFKSSGTSARDVGNMWDYVKCDY